MLDIIFNTGFPCHICLKKKIINKRQMKIIEGSESVAYCTICNTEKAMSNTRSNKEGLLSIKKIVDQIKGV
jgi:hypothetical protein